MALEPGTTLGPYAVTVKIGEGGMGEVYRARDTKLDRDVALKVLPQAFTEDPDRLARFEREAKVPVSGKRPRSTPRRDYFGGGFPADFPIGRSPLEFPILHGGRTSVDVDNGSRTGRGTKPRKERSCETNVDSAGSCRDGSVLWWVSTGTG